MHRTAVSVLLAFHDGGAFAKLVRFKEISSAEFPVAEKDANKIMHIALTVGKNNVLMASDVPESMGVNKEAVRIRRTKFDELVKLGRIKAIKKSRKIYVPVEEVDRYFSDSSVR